MQPRAPVNTDNRLADSLKIDGATLLFVFARWSSVRWGVGPGTSSPGKRTSAAPERLAGQCPPEVGPRRRGEAGRPGDRAALAAMNKCLAGAHSEFFEPPH